ncbi:MAG: hypothetical protein Q7S27_01175 [Nanoarchaeota archaeon]|nr:hypothetical protein [Nanoarchaeota archaeon]
MQLDEYLNAVEKCPDNTLKIEDGQSVSRLTAEYGIFDNWPILLNRDFREIAEDFKSLNFQLINNPQKYEKEFVYYYKPGTVELRVIDGVKFETPFLQGDKKIPFYENESQEEVNMRNLIAKRHNKIQKRSYKSTIMLHYYQVKKIPGLSNIEGISEAIIELANYAKQKGISFCFPKSVGWNNLYDYSKIVYYSPSNQMALSSK